MSDRRLQDLIRFYSILNRLEKTIGGARALADCRGRMKWPARGVYYFREAGENRSDTGEGPRVVRVGTHALKADAYDKMFFVWHSGDVGETDDSNVVLIGPDRLARMVFDAGLTSWLR